MTALGEFAIVCLLVIVIVQLYLAILELRRMADILECPNTIEIPKTLARSNDYLREMYHWLVKLPRDQAAKASQQARKARKK